jgi:hypothetical protein
VLKIGFIYEHGKEFVGGIIFRGVCTQLTPWSWALLGKPPVAQLLKNFPTIYGTRRFITVFTRALS